jgi:hypothetical protein
VDISLQVSFTDTNSNCIITVAVLATVVTAITELIVDISLQVSISDTNSNSI